MTTIATILIVLSCLLWLGLAANVLTIHAGDPAGRGLAVAYGAANAGLLLLAMGALFITCAIGRKAPPWLLLSSIVLVPGVCIACLGTLTLLARYTWMRWAAAAPLLGPGTLLGLVGCCVWFRREGLAPTVGELVAGAVIGLSCLLPWIGWLLAPGMQRRRAGLRRGAEADAAAGAEEPA